MRIAFVTNVYFPASPYSAVGAYISDTARELVRRGHEVFVFTTAFIDPFVYEDQGVVVVPVPVRKTPGWIPGIIRMESALMHSMRKIRGKRGWDIIEVVSDSPFGASLGLLPPAEGKLVVRVHQHRAPASLPDCQRILYDWLQHRKCLSADLCLANSRAAGCKWRKAHKLNGHNPVHYAWYGLDLSKFYPVASPKVNYRKKGEKIVFFSGRLTKGKGFFNLFRAFREIVTVKVPEAMFVFAGPNEEYLDLFEAEIRPYLSDKIVYAGCLNHDNLPDYYSQADFFVAPFLTPEAFGLVFIEAIACGCPVVATNAGSTPEIFKESKCACLFDDTSPEGIAKVLIELLKDEKRLSEMKRHSRSHAERHFALSVAVDRQERIYRQLLEGNLSPKTACC
ncbi:MAG: glycosyltransferase family 4 protein [bacterium]